MRMTYPLTTITIFLLVTMKIGGSDSTHKPPEISRCDPTCSCRPTKANDRDRIKFALNLEFLEAEFLLGGSTGKGLDHFAPGLTKGGPPPIGVRKAKLEPHVPPIIEELAYQEIGHLRAISQTVGGIPRPLLDLSPKIIGGFFDQMFGIKSEPPFNPYENTLHYLLTCYGIPYIGLVGYVGTIPCLEQTQSLCLVASLLGVEAGQDAVIRTLLYKRVNETVKPYNITVAEFTERFSNAQNKLAMCGNKGEGLIVPLNLGAENRTTSNILSADSYSLSYSRTPREILRIIYGSGDESTPGGFFPEGANGNIAKSYLKLKT